MKNTTKRKLKQKWNRLLDKMKFQMRKPKTKDVGKALLEAVDNFKTNEV